MYIWEIPFLKRSRREFSTIEACINDLLAQPEYDGAGDGDGPEPWSKGVGYIYNRVLVLTNGSPSNDPTNVAVLDTGILVEAKDNASDAIAIEHPTPPGTRDGGGEAGTPQEDGGDSVSNVCTLKGRGRSEARPSVFQPGDCYHTCI